MSDAQPVRPASVAILGLGSMGGAILHGLLAQDEPPASIRVTTKSQARAAALAPHPSVTALSTEQDPAANRHAVTDADVVILGLKPAMIPEVLEDVASSLKPDALVISVAAGVTIARMQALLPATVSVVRAMPNTPALVGRGMTGLVAPATVPTQHVATARALFEGVGKVLVVDAETQLDAVTAVSGSGPAYVFLLIEKFRAAAEGLGFSAEDAALLVQETFLGASLLLDETGTEPDELRRRVTSPGGTTERALAVFAETDLEGVFQGALAAAVRRSQELAAGS